jgi:hypothetical protein
MQRELTEQEDEALNMLGNAYWLFTQLPVLHADDRPEFKAAIHAAQNIILSRPAFDDILGMRKFREEGKLNAS